MSFKTMRIWIFSATLCFICVSDVFTLPPYKPYDIAYEGPTGMMTYNTGGIMMYCNKQNNKQIRPTEAFPPSNVTLSYSGVSIAQCNLTNTTYIDEFKALNINTTTIKWLNHRFNQDNPLPAGNYTEGLKITGLSIENENNHNFLQNVPNFLEPLVNLQSLYLSGVEIPPLPAEMRLINITFANNAIIKDWGNCRHLKRVSISDFAKESLPKWPVYCAKLEYLEIDRLLPETAHMVVDSMIAAAPSLQSLKITSCRLYNLPIEMIRSAKNLTYLDLSENQIYDELFPEFPFHSTLKTLDLSYNLIQRYGIGGLVAKLPALLKLILAGETEFFKVCTKEEASFIEPLQNSSIESIDFGYTAFDIDCFHNIRFLNLKNITLQTSNSVDLKLLQLPKTNAEHLLVDFGYNNFMRVLFDEADYETLRTENSSSPYNGRNLTVLLKYVSCDCDHGWLARALRDFPHIVSMPNLRCDHEYGIKILEEPKEHLECNMTGHNSCFYRQSWRDGSVVADCEIEAWTKMELKYPIQGLNVSGKGISSLHSNLTDTIKWLDLRHNQISRASAEEAAALFAGGRQVWLAGNLLLCDCDNRALLDAIQLHREQIEDYNLLKCVGTGEAISSISTAVLCRTALVASLTASAVLILLVGVVAVLVRRYGEQLRMFLYSRGCCITCLHRNDPDDKPYDAFISFAHEDQEYILETLLPGLENAPEKFRICVHYRDWLVGDWIPAQIMRSVQLSKRTLILLSRNFIASAWSTLELRYALANTLEDTNAKVLVLIKDDVLDMDLDAELRGYLTFNTYLCCDDPWFWEKLRYAMPHRQKNEIKNKDDAGTAVGEEISLDSTNVMMVDYSNPTNSV